MIDEILAFLTVAYNEYCIMDPSQKRAVPVIKILKIVPQKFKKEYRTVFIGPELSVKLHEDVVAQFKLAEGGEISEETLIELKNIEIRKEACEYAYLFLSYRTLTTQELTERLQRKGFPKDVIHSTLTLLKEQNLLNDAEFAKGFVEDKLKRKLVGDQKVREDLVRKGFDPDEAERIVQKVKSDGDSGVPDEDERAFQSLMKRSRQIKEIDSHTQHRRLYGHLVRQGFEADVIERVINRFRKERRLAEPEE